MKVRFKNRIEEEKDEQIRLSSNDIIYEDDDIICINKPAFLPTQPTVDTTRQNLFDALKQFLKKHDEKGDAYLGLHHRLDRDTSGVILFTKKTTANKSIGDQFKEHTIQKTYFAFSLLSLADAPKDIALIKRLKAGMVKKTFIAKIGNRGTGAFRDRRTTYGSVRTGGDYAETLIYLRDMKKHGENVLYQFECAPKTGRTHQIRIHLAESGFPILGDELYGGTFPYSHLKKRVMLHAWKLRFKHPTTGIEMEVCAKPPQIFQDVENQAKEIYG